MRKRVDPADHFGLAERHLEVAHEATRTGEDSAVVALSIAEAQVHATLALAQATTAARTLGGSVILSGKPDWP